MENRKLLAALSQDLMRVALGFQSGSEKMADVFVQEVLNGKAKIKIDELAPYIVTVLEKLPEILKNKNSQQKAEDALMYGAVLQNYVTRISLKNNN